MRDHSEKFYVCAKKEITDKIQSMKQSASKIQKDPYTMNDFIHIIQTQMNELKVTMARIHNELQEENEELDVATENGEAFDLTHLDVLKNLGCLVVSLSPRTFNSFLAECRPKMQVNNIDETAQYRKMTIMLDKSISEEESFGQRTNTTTIIGWTPTKRIMLHGILD